MTDMVPLTRLSGSVPKNVSFDFGASPNFISALRLYQAALTR